jgi:hypothetical protein
MIAPRTDTRLEAARRWREIEKHLRSCGWSRRQARVEVARLKREHERWHPAPA